VFTIDLTFCYSQEKYTADSAVYWTKKKGKLIEPVRPAWGPQGVVIEIDSLEKKINVYTKRFESYDIISLRKKSRSWVCGHFGMEGEEKCIITLNKGALINQISIDFGHRILIYYLR
jgi:hypothetical protein